MDLRAGSIVAGKFRLDRPLAQGGMGSVWVAFNTQLEVPVALKFMAPSMVGSAELVARFEREAKGAAQLRSPHVVQIFEHGLDRGTPFIAMELLEGEDLGARLRERGRLSVAETARILGDVCKALRRAHEKGLVHRDLKPANIFLCKHEEYEVVKVLDFGIAKSVAPGGEGDVTQTGALVGSPHYMAPEQARRTNKEVDHRSDLWALGVIAYRAITGRLPFPGDDLIDVLVRICTDAAPAPSSLARSFGPDMDRFFARALARDPDARFQSAKEMADALTQLAGRESAPALDRSGSGVKPPPPSGQPAAPPPRPSQSAQPAVPAPRSAQSGQFPAAPGPRSAQSGQFPAAPAPRSAQSGQFPAAPAPVPEPAHPSVAEEPADFATTIPLHDPRARRAIAAAPWAAKAGPAVAHAPMDLPTPGPGGYPFAPGRDSSATFAATPTFQAPPAQPAPAPLQAAAGPFFGAPSNGFGAPSSGVDAGPASGRTVQGFVTGGAPAFVIPADGTLTSAGAEVPAPSVKKGEKPWIALAAAGAAVVVIAVVAGAVLLSRDPVSGAAGDGAATSSLVQWPPPSATASERRDAPVPSVVPPAVVPPAVVPPASTATNVAPAADPTSSAAAKPSPSSGPTVAPTASAKRPRPSDKLPGAPAPKPSGGQLGGPKF